MKKRFHLLLAGFFICSCLFSLCAASALHAETAEISDTLQIKELMLDPRVSDLYVPPPMHLDDLVLENALTASFVINYLPAGSDPYGIGDTCVTFPDDAKAAFEYATSIWASQIISAVPIVIDACWASNLPAGVIGHSAAIGSVANFTGAPYASTMYNFSLANALAGVDLYPTYSDMYIAYSNIFPFYYDTSGVTPTDEVDFASVVLHEIAHSLNFSGRMAVSGGLGKWGGSNGLASIYDRFTVDGSGNSLINTSVYANNSAALAAALQSGAVYFNGANARAANSSSNVKLYAPASWAQGSSYAHVDEIFNGTANALMTYSIAYGEQIHNVGPIAKGILQDLGWQFSTSTTTTSVASTTSTTSIAPTTTTTSVAPTTSTTSVAPTTSTTSVAPTTSTTSVAPTTSTTSVAPTTSTTSVAPTTSTTSVAPTTSTTSVAPTTSTTSVAPTTSTTSGAPTTTKTRLIFA